MEHLGEIIRDIINGNINSPDELQKAKMNYCKKYNISDLPKNSVILEYADQMENVERKDVVKILQRKPSRKKSGVTVIACMTSPEECPHGKCLMCPGGPEGTDPSPQSYTGKEPAALRGYRNKYDPYEQVKDRLKQYKAIGHKIDKVELIIMGGTFPARDWEYQKYFVRRCFDGLNDEISESLYKAKKRNETANRRCIGLTIETRPDFCKDNHLDRMLKLGATRVEIGVQTLRNNLLKFIERGHTVKDSIEATKLAKEKGFKVCYHMMPGLPGSNIDEDIREFKQLFKDQRFKPDMLKIYPTLVLKGTKLYELWENGEYEPLKTKEGAKLVAEMKKIVPKYVRIQRVQRDIPSPLVEAGIKKSNLRQYARKILDNEGIKCNCIRCREAGHTEKEANISEIEMNKIKYSASDGKEYFIELVDDNIIVAYSRLRICDNHQPILRELKVVGSMTPINEKGINYQHKGLGKRLVIESEKIAKSYGEKLRVISGIGAREYYRKLNYRLEEPYMVKNL